MAAGGGAKTRLWLEIKASAPGSPITQGGQFPERGIVWELNYRVKSSFWIKHERREGSAITKQYFAGTSFESSITVGSIAPEVGTQVVLGDVARVLSPAPLDAGDTVVIVLHDLYPRPGLEVKERPFGFEATVHVSHRLLHLPSIKSHKGG